MTEKSPATKEKQEEQVMLLQLTEVFIRECD